MKNDIVGSSLIERESFFWTPDYLEQSAWIEHVPFAFWLIDVLRPRMVVELGVHSGTSYFAFCQAVKTLNLTTACYGIDTWKGDEHAGFYNEEIFAKVSGYNAKEYSRFSTLVRATFDEAKDYFVDGSIDLLHIDGLHTYETVKHDFETWLPKLASNAVVVLHDINVRERGFGVFRFWEELKGKYQHFQFDFGYGLGVLTIGEVAQEELHKLFRADGGGSYYLFLRNLFSSRGAAFKSEQHFIEVLQRGSTASNKFDALSKSNEQLCENFRSRELHCQQLEARNEHLEADKKQLEERYTQLQEAYTELEGKLAAAASEVQSLISKSEKEAKEWKQKLELADYSFKKVKEELTVQQSAIEELNAHILKHKQIIRWYRATYEDRSLLGTIKEKISHRKSQKTSESNAAGGRESAKDHTGGPSLPGNPDTRPVLKKDRYRLIPAQGITYKASSNEYVLGEEDPFFLVDLKDRRLGAGWYWLSLEIEVTKGTLVAPRLYYDYGNGFNEKDIWELPDLKNNKIEGLVKFPFDIFELRLDPSVRGCSFKVDTLQLKSISKVKAFQIALSNYRQIHFPNRKFAPVITDLVASFLEGGKLEVKKKIRSSIEYKGEKIEDQYAEWCQMYDTLTEIDIERVKQLSEQLDYKPLFSVIMPVYNAPVYFLKRAIESVQSQAYDNWELCIADDQSTDEEVAQLLKAYQEQDSRIKVVFRAVNGHISKASNSALEVAEGEYIVLLDQDDELRPHSLYMVAKALNENRGLELIYSDEDKIDERGRRYDPYFKTDWNKDLFYGQNFISHLGVYKRSLIQKIEGFREGFEGSQDYDLALRCIEHLEPQQIHHIPHVLYHWRAITGSTAVAVENKGYAFEAGLKALNDHLKRTGQNAVAVGNANNSYRVKWGLPEQKPKISIIIPTKDKVEVLATCVESIVKKTDYERYEVLVIDNNSEEAATFKYYKQVQESYEQVKVYTYNHPFNFSAIVNYGVEKSTGEIVVLLNNDMEIISNDWLCEMAAQCLRDEIGAVGAKLYYPNDLIQHAGVFLTDGHPGIHIYRKKHRSDPGYFNKLNLIQNYTAVTAACLAIRKELYLKVEGYDEENLKVAYNDVDFCLRVKELGYRNLWTPFAELYHYESLSRGDDLAEVNFSRFKKEHGYMLSKWKREMRDPYFNSNLSIETYTVQYAFPPRVAYEWRGGVSIK